MLHRGVDGEHIELVHLAELGAQGCGRRHIAHFPAGHMVGFTKARHDEGTRRQAGVARCALVRHAVEHHVLIDLVADQQDVGWCQQLLQAQHFLRSPDHATGVVRRVDQDGAGFGGDGGGDFVEIRPEAARRQRHRYRDATRQLDVGDVAVVAGFEHDHLIARVHHGQDCRDDGLRSASRDGDLGCWVIVAPVHGLHFGGYRLAQGRHAGHGRVLVKSLGHGRGHPLD